MPDPKDPNDVRTPLEPIECGEIVVSIALPVENGLNDPLITIHDRFSSVLHVYAWVDTEVPLLIKALQTLYDEWQATQPSEPSHVRRERETLNA